MKQTVTAIVLSISLLLSLLPGTLNAVELPILGDSSSDIISLDEEHRLGNAWVRILRAQAPLLDDPLSYSFVQQLLQQLSVYSHLQDRRLTLVVIDDNTLNAFAVPGGVIGVNAGLFLHSNTESEFASVLAHELSHLSQRHYAQRLAEEQKSLPLQLATTLAGILLMATTDSQAGAAAIMGGQAAAVQNSLAFSRSNEQEADRVGMQVLVESGFDPRAMPRMFSQLQRSTSSMGRKPPEFLLTHPVTESRIADALNRSAQLPQRGRVNSLDYQLIRTRIQVLSMRNNQRALQHFQQEVDNNPKPANRYGLAFSALRNNQPELAQQQIDLLLQQQLTPLPYRLLQAELWNTSGQAKRASDLLQQMLSVYPNSHPITMLLAQSLHLQDRQQQVVDLLESHSRLHSDDVQLWYLLAEAYGLANDIKGVHLARAEYFMLTASVPRARQHLQLALKQPNVSEHEKLLIEQRIKDAELLQLDLNF
ncbi:MAG: M48 family metalloprotease [Motiliproteus sp.]